MLRRPRTQYQGLSRVRQTESYFADRENARVFPPPPPPQGGRAQRTPAALTLTPAVPTPGAGPPRPTQSQVNPLDPITVAHSADMRAVRECAAQVPGARWGRNLARFLEHGFPRTPGDAHVSERPPDRAVVAEKYLQNITRLVRQQGEPQGGGKLLRQANRKAKRGWVGYFQVLKALAVDRAIVNCSDTNEGYEEPPPLRLAEFPDLMAIIKSYGPGVHVGSADIRHFFWQISLPEPDREFFSTQIAGRTYEWTALPMGWSWSPWVAQGTASLAVYGMAKRLRARVVPGPGTDESPAPYYHIVDEAGNRTATVVIWYDNFLVLTHDGKTRSIVIRQLNNAMNELRLQWKLDRTTNKPWALTVGCGEYIGVQFRWHDGAFEWSHIDGNPAEWAADAPPDALAQEVGLPRLASILGVMVHDAAVRISRGHDPHIHSIMSRAGTAYATLPKAEWPSHVVTLTIEELAALRDAWRQVLRNDWQTFEPRESAVVVASDATASKSAMVFLGNVEGDPRGRPLPVVHEGTYEQTDINRIEALVAIDSIEWAARQPETPDGALIIAVVDNTSAVAWLNGRGAPDRVVHDAKVRMAETLAKRSQAFVVRWVDTKSQPADEPSRNRPVCPEKARNCLREARAWYHDTFAANAPIQQAQSHRTRRPREDNRCNEQQPTSPPQPRPAA